MVLGSSDDGQFRDKVWVCYNWTLTSEQKAITHIKVIVRDERSGTRPHGTLISRYVFGCVQCVVHRISDHYLIFPSPIVFETCIAYRSCAE